MALPTQRKFAKDSVHIHINVQDAEDKEAHIAGRVFLLTKPEGDFIEWKAEEFLSDTQNEEWDIVGPVGYRSDRDADSGKCDAEQEEVLYIPLPGKTRKGKQIYRFGKASIYYDHNVVFMQDPNSGQWLPTSLDQLTNAAK